VEVGGWILEGLFGFCGFILDLLNIGLTEINYHADFVYIDEWEAKSIRLKTFQALQAMNIKLNSVRLHQCQ
jgi:hypothetical protein